MIATRSARATATCRFCSIDDRRQPALAQAGDRLGHAIDEQRSEPLGRLVEEQDARVREQRASDREHLLLAAGELVAVMAPPLLEPGQQVVDVAQAPLDLAAGDRAAGELQVLLDREAREDPPPLRDDRDPGARDRVRALAGQVAPVQQHAARPRPHQPDDRVDERRLADAVPSEQRDHLALLQVEVDAVQHVARVVSGADAAELEQRAHEVNSSSIRSPGPR